MLQARLEEARRILQVRLGHEFADEALFRRALTHRSAGPDNNERLEFLGDAILSFVIAEALYSLGSALREGQLTRRRAALVRKDTLADLAREIELGAALELGSGELKSGGRDRDSILADAFEGIVGALYNDAGYAVCRERILALFQGRLTRVLRSSEERDPKTRLQELLQARGDSLPGYEVLLVDGAAHQQHFTVVCTVESADLRVTGEGGSRRKAEQAAAAAVLKQIAGEADG